MVGFLIFQPSPSALAAEVVWKVMSAMPDVDELVPEPISPLESRFPIAVRVTSKPGNTDATAYYGDIYIREGDFKRRLDNMLSPLQKDIESVSGDYLVQGISIPIYLDQALGEALTSTFEQLFPAGIAPTSRKRKSTPIPPQEPHLLEAVYSFSTKVLGAPGGAGPGVQAQLQLELFDGAHAPIVTVDCSGEDRKGFNFWSPALLVEAYTEDAFRLAISSCIQSLRGSPSLRRVLDSFERLSTAPATLLASIELDDNDSLLPNGRLDAGEAARLRVKVRNEGPGKAFGLSLRLSSDEPSLIVPAVTGLGDLGVGADLVYEISFHSTLGLPARPIALRAEVLENRGYAARSILLEVAAVSFASPALEIFDVAINDATPPAVGDGDGLPGAGETVEVVVRVRNSGAGDALGVRVGLLEPLASVHVLSTPGIIQRLASHDIAESRFLLAVSRNGLAPQLQLTFSAVDGRGELAASTTRQQGWSTVARAPRLRVTTQLADGASPGSRGNSDGIANNGETVELILAVSNDGSLSSENVRLELASSTDLLQPKPAQVDFGTLPAGATSRSQWVVLSLPRGFGAGAQPARLPLTARIRQDGFPDLVQDLPVEFWSLQPQLELSVPSVVELERGTARELSLELRNSGDLAAEQVQVTLESSMPGVDLLDDLGLPRTKREVLLDIVPSRGARRIRVPISVRTGAGPGEAPLVVSVTQRDFAPLRTNAAVRVVEQAPVVMSAAPPEPVPQPATPARAVLAPTISFLRQQFGEKVAQEAIVLRFEIQHATELEDVRLRLNDRPVALDSSPARTVRDGSLNASTYELPVQLARGENRFEVTAITADGQRGVRVLSLYRDDESRRVWLVAIGVSSYQDTAIRPLRYAHKDAEAVAAYFRTALDLPAEQVFVRTNEQATLREVRSLLGTVLPQRATSAGDTVILFLAGHGMPEQAIGIAEPDGLTKYFLPVDAVSADLYSSALPMSELELILRRYRAERVVVMIDSCFSGASTAGGRTVFGGNGSVRNSLSAEFLSRLASAGSGRAILAASEPNQVAVEDNRLEHGLFTYYLLEGLRGAADSSGDGLIDLDELYRHVSAQVESASGGFQKPMRSYPALLGQILIGRALPPEPDAPE